ncbi:hypothetical protein D019_4545 [Vibrio parahaemolyticus VP2007-095]|nr:hypothetical protein D019_4545 [Vibrio parahaemolyticus VP2007-095]
MNENRHLCMAVFCFWAQINHNIDMVIMLFLLTWLQKRGGQLGD